MHVVTPSTTKVFANSFLFESVEEYYNDLNMVLELIEDSIVYPISGFPASNFIFFLGIPFEPPRAAIKQIDCM